MSESPQERGKGEIRLPHVNGKLVGVRAHAMERLPGFAAPRSWIDGTKEGRR